MKCIILLCTALSLELLVITTETVSANSIKNNIAEYNEPEMDCNLYQLRQSISSVARLTLNPKESTYLLCKFPAKSFSLLRSAYKIHYSSMGFIFPNFTSKNFSQYSFKVISLKIIFMILWLKLLLVETHVDKHYDYT